MKGILFKPKIIQAIIEGRKTQFTRVIKPQPKRINDDFDGTWEWKEKGHYYDDLTLASMLRENARYQVGEVVYIKEAFCPECYKIDGVEDACYKIDEYDPESIPTYIDCLEFKWKSPLFMPAWAARYFIVITDVEVQKVQEISFVDILYEGWDVRTSEPLTDRTAGEDARDWFRNLWDSINPKYPWESNPWVFAYTFKIKQ